MASWLQSTPRVMYSTVSNAAREDVVGGGGGGKGAHVGLHDSSQP